MGAQWAQPGPSEAEVETASDGDSDGDGEEYHQYARSVERFSSHYGRNVSGGQSAYSAPNLAGPPSVPSYGDHTQAMVLVRKKCCFLLSTLSWFYPTFRTSA